MCYANGSLDQATKICPMCKVFPNTRCPHIKDVCRNRTSHPRHEVVFLKNAEVQSFKGCGFCKWDRINPPQKRAGLQNPGWPGCCRPPSTNEHQLIPAADWHSVSVVHQIPIPPDIKSILDSLTNRGSTTTRGSPSIPSGDKRSSGNASPSHKSTLTLGKTPSVAIPIKARSGGSPQPPISSSRGSGGSVPTSSSMDQYQSMRRQTHPDTATEKRHDAPHSSHSSPSRKNIDLETTLSRRNSGGRPSVVAITQQLAATTLSPAQIQAQGTTFLRRQASVTSSNSTSNKFPSLGARSVNDRGTGSVPPLRILPKRPSLDMSSASSSSGSSDGLGSATDGTVMSDGFTDYLSDESEAELQRQAEAKAALVAQNQAEEQEFRAARQQLAHVDLRPPKSWNVSR